MNLRAESPKLPEINQTPLLPVVEAASKLLDAFAFLLSRKSATIQTAIILDLPQGFEPRSLGPKPRVLPLDEGRS